MGNIHPIKRGGFKPGRQRPCMGSSKWDPRLVLQERRDAPNPMNSDEAPPAGSARLTVCCPYRNPGVEWVITNHLN